MIEDANNTLSLTTDEEGNTALKIERDTSKNLSLNFPSSSNTMLDKPSGQFNLIVDNLTFSNDNVHTSEGEIFQDNGYNGYNNPNYRATGCTATITSLNTLVTYNTGTTATWTPKVSMTHLKRTHIEFKYIYDSSVTTSNQGIRLVDLDGNVLLSKSFNQIFGSISSNVDVTIDVYHPQLIVIKADDELIVINNVTIDEGYQFEFWLTQGSIKYNRFHIDVSDDVFKDNGLQTDYNDDWELSFTDSNDEVTSDTILVRSSTYSTVQTTGSADGLGEAYPNILLNKGFEISVKIHEYSENTGFIFGSKYHDKEKLSFDDIDVPANGGNVFITYDGFKIIASVDGEEDTDHIIYAKFGDSIQVGFYLDKTSTNESLKFSYLEYSYDENSFYDAGYNSTSNTTYALNEYCAIAVDDTKTTLTSKYSNGIATAYPKNARTNLPIYLLGDSKIEFNYLTDGGDGSNNAIEFINGLGNRHNKIYINELFQNENYKLKIKYEQEKGKIDSANDCLNWITTHQNDTGYDNTKPVGLIYDNTAHTVKSYSAINTYTTYNLIQSGQTYITPQEAIDNLKQSYRVYSDSGATVTSTACTTYLESLVTEGMLELTINGAEVGSAQAGDEIGGVGTTYTVKQAVLNATPIKEVTDCLITCIIEDDELNIKVNNVVKYTRDLNFSTSNDYFIKFRNYHAEGGFMFNNLKIYNDIYDLVFKCKCRGFDSQGRIHRNNQYEIGIWENEQTITVLNKDNKAKITFTDVPDEVEYIDFVFTFSDNVETITMSKFMLYEGSEDLKWQEDTTSKRADTSYVNFKRNFYANLYNKDDKVGLSVIRPYLDSIALTSLLHSETTALYPYMKQCKDEDDPSRVALEYLKANDQDINISWK